jgi:hypothetical protein
MKIIRPYAITDATLTACNVPENDYPVYSGTTTYALGAMVIVIGGNVHTVYQSLQATNVGHDPASNPDWWLDSGMTNRWKMFDTLVNTQTEYAGDITFTLAISGRVNSISLLNIYASSVRIVASDTVDGVIFDRTIDMRANLGIVNWFDYFFEPPEWDTDAVVTDLPMYANMTISVTLSNISGQAKCGACIAGLIKIVGDIQYGTSVGIQDYSIKTRDAWGNATVLERAYDKHANFTINVDNSNIDRLQNILAGYRATPILYIGVDQFGSTAILGFYKDFSIAINYFSYSVCTIEIEGLI